MKIGSHNINEELISGSLYFIVSSIKGVQETLFGSNQMKISYVNSYFDGAIKIQPYIEKNPITTETINVLKSYYPNASISDESHGIYNQLIFTMLKELIEKDIAVVETTGLSPDSIIDFVQFWYKFMDVNKNKTVIIIQLDSIKTHYPDFKLKNLSQDGLQDFDIWLKNVALK